MNKLFLAAVILLIPQAASAQRDWYGDMLERSRQRQLLQEQQQQLYDIERNQWEIERGQREQNQRLEQMERDKDRLRR